MRCIKFRGWDNGDKVMVYNLNSLSLFDGELRPNGYVLMQYTGLKDKNGKDIYDGDIFVHEKYINDPTQYTLMVWKECTSEPFSIRHYDDPEYYVVIGNKYENPELLEVK